MSSSNTRLNEVLKFAETYNTMSKGQKITPLQALKIYLKLEKGQG